MPHDRIALASQKGGVGKTTLALMMAAALARTGKLVLVVDVDPQASATRALGVDLEELTSPTLADLFLSPGEVGLDDVIVPTSWEGVEVAPSHVQLTRAEQSRRTGDEFTLRTALEESNGRHDVVLIDCPPSLGILAINGMVAAAGVVIVTQPAYLDLGGLQDLADTLATVRRFYHPQLETRGIVVNMVDHDSESAEGLQELREAFSAHLVEPFMPRRVAVRKAIRAGATLYAFGRRHRADEAAPIVEQITREVTRGGDA